MLRYLSGDHCSYIIYSVVSMQIKFIQGSHFTFFSVDFEIVKQIVVLVGDKSKKRITNKNRAPTISFVSKTKSSKDIAKLLVDNKIATRNDNFYAWRCLKYLGIDVDDGVIRLSMTHYNNLDDTNKVIKALEKIT